ncbi:1-deoxy-D-xylulose-5-phosphate synthase [candidate division KSB1 bacterium]|nr:1-deoxy-D-xylulose-5-phosphate synthase [candidate division KSB1 bacterium]MBL7094263.1 1-deoxy-D-xylulose-5-phosphate synthase [candidate division KSB1 bacterium]
MNKLMDKINSPEDLKVFSVPELANLAKELREFIITNISQTGGHLAPSLGVVELSLVLHYLFDSPRDKIIWDVGHQAYVHKIITGRKDRFSTIRQLNGISGFPKISESEHDHFGTGHASTSISAALGMACARDMAGDDYNVMAVIGDGALTGGLALEGLNNTGASGKNIIVILNDNEMSISKNVGAFANYLTTLITTQSYNKLKNEVWQITGKLSTLGTKIRKIVGRVDESLKSILVPGLLFERLGFRYFGPIDGHNISRLIRVLKLVKTLEGPMLVHVITRKGKGYEPAEKNAPVFHGLGAFDKETGKTVKKSDIPPGYNTVFGKSLAEFGAENNKIVAITAAMALGTGLIHFADKFPERFFDVGIAEGHAVTFAAGLASQGYKPVVTLYSSFLQRAYDSVIHDVALQNLPVVFGIDRAGLVGDDGPTHHGVFDLSFLRIVPNLVVMAPKDEFELKRMLYTALKYEKGPIAMRYPRGSGIGIALDSLIKEIEIGKSEVIAQGKDALIIGIGPVVYNALKAREILSGLNIDVQVVNARFVKPLNEAFFKKMFQKFELIITLEDNAIQGGFGSAIGELLLQTPDTNVILHKIGIPDEFIEQGTLAELYEQVGLDVNGIVKAVKEKMKLIKPRKRGLKKWI